MNEEQVALLARAAALRQRCFEELLKRLGPEELDLVWRWEALMLYSALLGGMRPGPNWDEGEGWRGLGKMIHEGH